MGSTLGEGQHLSYQVACTGNKSLEREPHETCRQTLNSLGWLLPQHPTETTEVFVQKGSHGVNEERRMIAGGGGLWSVDKELS